ncbi:MAG: glycosyltransferase family 4 protein [Sphingobacteriaceae bacterium]|nr:glycosyltransferase family 4 protein [Sphingobacteriaceae bacterium]
MKSVLFFFPLNPYNQNEGCKIRVIKLLEYFKSRHFRVDFISLEGWDDWENIHDFKSSGLVNSVQLFQKKPVKNNYLRYYFDYKLPKRGFESKLYVKGAIPNYATFYTQVCFNKVLKANKYDFILISYAYWADLIKGNELLKGAKTIIDTHDFLTSQHQTDKEFSLGTSIQEELRRLSLFDEVWAISNDEQFVFSQFLNQKIRLVPVMFSDPGQSDEVKKDFDLIYVASDNKNNVKSINWFFSEVYPLLPKELRICIIGKVTSHLAVELEVTKVSYAEDLNQFYQKAKVSICPMLAGTGVKVKVVEALSYGLPVVCTQRGIDGLPNKTNNGCLVSNDPVEFAANIKSLLLNKTFYNQQRAYAIEHFKSAFEANSCMKSLDKCFI